MIEFLDQCGWGLLLLNQYGVLASVYVFFLNCGEPKNINSGDEYIIVADYKTGTYPGLQPGIFRYFVVVVNNYNLYPYMFTYKR